MRKHNRWKEQRIDSYLKGLAGREANKHIVEDRFVSQAIKMQGFDSKIVPASYVDLEQVWDAFENFDASNDFNLNLEDPHIQSGIRFARKIFGSYKMKLKPLPLVEVVDKMTLDTSAGLTCFGTKKIDCVEYALTRAAQVLQGLKKPRPCLAGIRTQAKDDGGEYWTIEEVLEHYKGKTRLVWMYPFEMTIIEGKFAIPLIDYFKKLRGPMTIGVPKGILGGRIFHEIERYRTVLALDYSKFDSTICSKLIKIAFRILKSLFGVFSEEDHKAWNRTMNFFLETTIVMPDGYLYVGKKHGVPSGSFFTQLIDSVVNAILIGAMSSRFKLGIHPRNFMILGDDALLGTPVRITKSMLTEMSHWLRTTCGIIMHPDKCMLKAHYLGAYWKNGIPTRPLKEVIPKMRFPEGFREYSKNPLIRKTQVRGIFLSYSACYWNLAAPLIYKWKKPTHIDGHVIKQYGEQFSVTEIKEFNSGLTGYMAYKEKYEENINWSRDFALVQWS